MFELLRFVLNEWIVSLIVVSVEFYAIYPVLVFLFASTNQSLMRPGTEIDRRAAAAQLLQLVKIILDSWTLL